MAQGKRELPKHPAFDDLLYRLDPIDAAIFAAGAIAGYNGLTPTTALFNLGKGISNAVETLQATASAHPEATLLAFSPVLMFGYLFTRPEEETTTDQSVTGIDAFRLSMAMIGGVEAIMMTRPGFAPALLQMAGDTLGTLKDVGGKALSAALI